MAPRPDNCPVDSSHDCPADRAPSARIVSDKRMATADMEVLEGHLGLVLSRVDDVVARIEGLPDGIKTAVSDGVRDGIKAAATDPEFAAKFWSHGFDALSSHAGKASSQWVGSRILTAAVIAVVSAGVAWLVKSGKI